MRATSARFHRLAIALLSGAALCLASAMPTRSQDRYPSRTITITVPYPAGGIADLMARPLAMALERELNQTVIVANKPGAAGGIGTQAVLHAPADGYSMLVTLLSISTLPAISAATGKPAMFARDQFTGIARIAADPCVVFVKSDAAWKTFSEMVADAKKRPDAITYSSSGLYGPAHLPMEMLQHATGTALRHVPTNGGAPALNLLIGGHVDMFCAVPALAKEFIEAGRLRGLASTGVTRIAGLPGVPTLKELGFDVDYTLWIGLFMPKNVRGDIRKTIDQSVAKIAADPAFKDAINKTGSTFAYQGAAEFQTWWDQDAAKMEAVIKRLVASEPK
jgi:tripartite-type tricarboxylate transporter receptor subunit TctC